MRSMSGGIINSREDFLSNIHAEMEVEYSHVVISRYSLTEFSDSLATPQSPFRFILSLTPLPDHLQGRYPMHWSEHRHFSLGNFFLVPPNEVLALRCDANSGESETSLTCITCHLNDELLRKWFPGTLEWHPRQLEKTLNIPEVSMHAIMKMIARELVYTVFSSEEMVGMLVRQLAIEAGRYLSAEEHEPVKGGLATWRLRLIDERIKEPGKPPTLEELAELCRISVRQLSRGFRVSRGCSLGSYIEYVRFEHAKRMILSGEHIKSVSKNMGYGSQSSFTKAFRRATGVTPSQFQFRA